MRIYLFTSCLAFTLCGLIFEAQAETNLVVFCKSLTSNVQLVVTRSDNNYSPTNSDPAGFDKWLRELPPGVKVRMADLENTYKFFLSTNGFVPGVEIWQTKVASFKNNAAPSAYVILDGWISETNLIVAYRFNASIYCDVINLTSKQGLPKEKTFVIREEQTAGASADSVKITQEPKDGTAALVVSFPTKPPASFILLEGVWVRKNDNQ